MKKHMKKAILIAFFSFLIAFSGLYKNTASEIVNAASYDISWYSTTADSFEIATAEEFFGFAKIVNGEISGIDSDTFAGKSIVLTEKIDLGNFEWTPIGKSSSKPFSGRFTGNEISNLNISEDFNFAGLFGYVYGGSLSMSKQALIENVKLVSGEINSQSENVGGVVAFGNYVHITNCENRINVNGKTNVGGIVGCYSSNLAITNCVNSGNISSNLAENSCAGGIVGKMSYISRGSINKSMNSGDVSGGNAGGIVGLVESLTKVNYDGLTNLGNVFGKFSAGGIIGYGSGNFDVNAKEFGVANYGQIKSDFSLGGIIGTVDAEEYNSNIKHCFNAGSLVKNSSDNIGYIIGKCLNAQNLNITYCINDRQMSGINKLIGQGSANNSSCYTFNTKKIIGLELSTLLEDGYTYSESCYPVPTLFVNSDIVKLFASPILLFESEESFDTLFTIKNSLKINKNLVFTQKNDKFTEGLTDSDFKTIKINMRSCGGNDEITLSSGNAKRNLELYLLRPILSGIDQPDSIFDGTSLVLTSPVVDKNGSDIINCGWQISKNNFETITNYNGEVLDLSYNNAKLRYFARNADGVSYSNIVSIQVKRLKGNVEFVEYCETQCQNLSLYFGDTTQLPIIQKEGYTFDGWCLSSENGNGNGNVITNFVMPVLANNDDTLFLFAKWSVREYKVKFDFDGGTGGTAEIQSVYDKQMNSSVYPPTKQGYSFAGYFTQKNGQGKQYYSPSIQSLNIMDCAEELQLYAYWAVESTVINFDKQSGINGSDTISATFGNLLGDIVVPLKVGYNFTGYFTEQDGEGKMFYNALGKSDVRAYFNTGAISLYAYWEKIIVSITFDTQKEQSEFQSIDAHYGEPMPLQSAPERQGFTFGGYFTQQNGLGTEYYTQTMASAKNCDLTANTVLYAKWTVKKTQVNLNLTGGVGGTQNIVATYGENLPSIVLPTKEGFNFSGYCSEMNGEGEEYYNYKGDGLKRWNKEELEITLYAKWTTYFESGDGTKNNPYIVKTSEQLFELARLVNEDIFDHENIDLASDGLTQLRYREKCYKLIADITLNTGECADWGDTPAALSWQSIGNTYYDFDGEFDGNNHKLCGFYQKIDSYGGIFGHLGENAKIYDLTVENSYFESGIMYLGAIAGYNKGLIKDCVSNGIVTSAGSQTGGIVGSNAGEINHCRNIASVKSENKSGGIAGENSSIIKNCVNNGIILSFSISGGVAGFNKGVILNSFNNCLKISANLIAGGIVGENNSEGVVNYVYNTSSIVAEAKLGAIAGINEGDLFNAYYESDVLESIKAINGTDIPENNVKGVPMFVMKSFNRDNYLATPSVGAMLNALIVEIQDGTLLTWFCNENSYPELLDNTYIYKLTLNLNGGQLDCYNGEKYYLTSQQKNLPQAQSVSKFGYEFDGWTLTNSVTDIDYKTQIAINSSGEKAFYAKWSKKSTQITLDNCNQSQSAITATFDCDMPALTQVPTKYGYVFDGYYSGRNGTLKKYYNSDLSSACKWDKDEYSLTLYAGYKPSTTQLIFNRAGGTGGTISQNVVFAGSIDAVAPSREGYDFMGYFSSIGGKGEHIFDNNMKMLSNWNKQEEQFEIYAYWLEKQFTITFNTSGGENIKEQKVYNNYSINVISDLITPTRYGYTFKYWTIDDEEISDSTVFNFNEDKVAVAHWTAKKYSIILETGETSQTINATFDQQLPSVPIPSRSGYIFKGYFTQENGEGIMLYDEEMNSQVFKIDENVTLYAYFVKQSVPLWFVLTLCAIGLIVISINIAFVLNKKKKRI